MHLSPYNGVTTSSALDVFLFSHRTNCTGQLILLMLNRVLCTPCPKINLKFDCKVLRLQYILHVYPIFYIVFYILGTDTDNNGGATSEYHYPNVFLQMICLILLYCLMGSNAFNMFKPI